MSYLKSVADVAAVIGAQCGTGAPNATDVKFIAMLDDVHAHIENALNVPSLERFGYTDKFELLARFTHKTETFRLHAGFVEASSVEVTDPLGEVVNSDRLSINAELGTILIDDPIYGRYTIKYNAGFAADNSTPAIFIGTPSWLRGLVDHAAVLWFRSTQLKQAVQESISFAQMMAPVYREIASRIYGRYQRPRVRVTLPYACTPSAPF